MFSTELTLTDSSDRSCNYVLGSSLCTIQGDAHYYTFDKKRFNYQGICKYLVAKPRVRTTGVPYFEVYAKNDQRYGQTSISYVDYAEIVYGGDTIRLIRIGGSTWRTEHLGVINVTVSFRHYTRREAIINTVVVYCFIRENSRIPEASTQANFRKGIMFLSNAGVGVGS